MYADNQSWLIRDEFSIRTIPDADFKPLLKKHTPTFFDEKHQVFRLRNAMSEADLEKISVLEKTAGEPVELRLGLFKKEEFIGWSYSRQDRTSNLYMQSAVVFPEFRRNGFYSRLVEKTIELARDAGFVAILSRHVATNNPVIIAKLKLGFRITALELTEGTDDR